MSPKIPKTTGSGWCNSAIMLAIVWELPVSLALAPGGFLFLEPQVPRGGLLVITFLLTFAQRRELPSFTHKL
ncbi:hypothetical protein EV401DRAFT_2016665 [Pisolithus croceorrhizus]|nr:hypothetical protein EV401DRAFT_2016665 [Pisolithus croceorrhizus]